MKILSALLILISLSAHASWNEVECQGKVSGKTFKIEVEKDVAGTPVFRRTKLIVITDGFEEVFEYEVSRRLPNGFNEIEYSDFGFHLVVDLFTHPVPRFGWSYKGTLESKVLKQIVKDVRCKFPYAY